MSKSTASAAIAAVASAPVAPVAPVSHFGDDGTRAAYYASMSRKDAVMFSSAVLPLLTPDQTSEVLAIVAKWTAEEAADKATGKLARLVRKGKSADKAYRVMGTVASFAADTANLAFAGHGRLGFTLLADVPATEERPSGRIKVIFLPDMLTDESGLPVPNEGHAAPVKVAADEAPADESTDSE